MMEVLNLIFTNGWTFFGTLLLIGATGKAVARVISAWRGRGA